MVGYNEIDAQDLFEMMAEKKLKVVDVRNQDEISKGVIPDSVHIALALLPLEYKSFDKSDIVVFYCHSGIRSAQAAAFLANKGHPQVFTLRGGVIAWGQAGYAFTR